MKIFTRCIALPLFALGLGATALSGAARAEDAAKPAPAMMAMKADPMHEDCMKKAMMETDTKKMKKMERACGKMGAMHSDAMMPKKK